VTVMDSEIRLQGRGKEGGRDEDENVRGKTATVCLPSGTGILRGYPSMPTHSCLPETSAMMGSCSTGCTHSGLVTEVEVEVF
jgi:hypothetical protein